MGGYDLPTSVGIGGRDYDIRSDFRAVLDVMQVMADAELEDEERAAIALSIFYPEAEEIPQADLAEAIDRMVWFVDGGEEPEEKPARKQGRKPRVMDWEQDFPLIIAPVNRVLGYEARSIPYDYEANEGGLHWWTFLAAYYEIGDCLFAQVVGIRKKRIAGKKLDKSDEQFYRDNRRLVDLRRKETAAEHELIRDWI